MKKPFLLGIALLALGVLGTIASADVSQHNIHVVGLFPPSQLDLYLPFPDQTRLNLAEDVFKVDTSYTEDVKNLLLRDRRDGFFTFHVHASLLDDQLHGVGLLMYNGLETEISEGFEEDQQRLLWFRLQKQPGRFGYGAEYLYVGRDFETPTKGKEVKKLIGSKVERDRAGGKIWGKWQLGVVGIKASLLKHWNNVDEDSHRPQFVTTAGEVAVSLALPSWPILSVAYKRGASESSREPEGFLPKTYLLETIEFSLYYGRTSWYAMLSSTYSLATDRHASGEKYLQLYHELSIAYYPTRLLYMEASVGFMEATSWPSYVQTTTPSLNLTLTYGRLFDRFDLKVEAYHDSTKSSDGLRDTRTIDVKAGVTWHLGEVFRGKATLSFKVGYLGYVDTVYPAMSYEELYGILFLKLLPMSASRS